MHPSAFSPGRTVPIGVLDKRITIQQASITRDAIGGPVVTWMDVATVWAHVHPLAGRERINAQSVYAEVTHLIIVRWQSEFSDPQAMAKMRIVYAGRRFAIGSAVDIDMAHQFLAISAQEGLSDG